MRLFDVLGPVMTGPSSSHTAGAVRIGLTARKLLGEPPAEAEILLHGSFAATGRGHGTDRALVAGLLGMQPDDEAIPRSFALAPRCRAPVFDWLGRAARRPPEHRAAAAGRPQRAQA